MPFNFRKSVRITKGVRVNLTSKGVGLSASAGGLRYSTRSRGRSTSGGCMQVIAFPFILLFNLYKWLFIGLFRLGKAAFSSERTPLAWIARIFLFIILITAAFSSFFSIPTEKGGTASTLSAILIGVILLGLSGLLVWLPFQTVKSTATPAEPIPSAWYTEDSSVYHNNLSCGPGQGIDPLNRHAGTGGKDLCSDCARLNQE